MDPKAGKQAFLFLCNKSTPANMEAFKAIQEATKDLGDAFILYHNKQEQPPEVIREQPHVCFTDNVLTQLNYFPIGFNLIPGNNHYPLMRFFLEHPGYRYYWNIEEDVRFNGSWEAFFEAFASIPHDFVSSHVRTAAEEPEWVWWPALMNPYQVIPFEDRIRSFNPIYRASGKALSFIHRSLSHCWSGHHEVLLPTLLHLNGYTIMDFGGTGQFVLPGFENRFYISNTPNPNGELSDGTMRYRPPYDVIGADADKDKLYHPVKG